MPVMPINQTNCGGGPGAIVTWHQVQGSGTITVRRQGQSTILFSITVNITTPLKSGSLPPHLRLPHSGSPGVLNAAPASGGNGLYTYQWQKSADNTHWSNVGNSNSSPWGLNYNPGPLGTDAYFRLRVTSGAQVAHSNSMLVEIVPALTPGEITYSQYLPPNITPAPLKGTTAKGEAGNYTYQWQQSTNGSSWSDISGATGVDYQPPALSTTTWYRRRVTATRFANGQSTTQFTNVSVLQVQGGASHRTPTFQPFVQSTQPVRELTNLPGLTSDHFNKTVSFTARRPSVQLPQHLGALSVADGFMQSSFADGLERGRQAVQHRATASGKDVIEASQYDAFGRQSADFLPYAHSPNGIGAFRPDFGTSQKNFYQALFPNEQYPYSYAITSDEVDAEVLGQSAPGNAFAGVNAPGRSTTRVYAEAEGVWDILLHNGQPAMHQSAASRFYGTRDLVVTESRDANNRRMVKYTDGEGKTVFEKLQESDNPDAGLNGWNGTCYVYDDRGNLRFVIPHEALVRWLQQVPGGDAGAHIILPATVRDELCFAFTYDVWGRVETKKVPGIAAETYVYDQLGRQVLSQDARQAAGNQWSYIRFDASGRPWQTATITTTTPVTTLRAQAAASANFLPAGTYDLQTETFYDHYGFPEAGGKAFNAAIMNSLASGPNEVVSHTPATITRGLLTGVKTKVLYPAGVPQGPQWLTVVNYYDAAGRLIQSQSDNILGGVDVTATRYNFTGAVVSQVLQHQNPKIAANHPTRQQQIIIVKRMEYYDNGAVHRVWQRINGGPEEVLVQQEYNDLGQVTKKTLGPNLESLNYKYNIQGQLTAINEAYVRNRTANHWWGTTLHYYEGFSNPAFDGTLTGLTWRSRGRWDEAHSFGFGYDGLSRLSRAHYTINNAAAPDGTGWTQTKNYSVDNLAYDASGNIQSMRSQTTAWGETKPLDNLSYQYENGTHRLRAVNDAAPVNDRLLHDFRDSVQQATEYSYDAAGNLTADNNKGLTATWNALDKPEAILLSGNRSLRYVYDATGQRLQKWVMDNGTNTSHSYIGGLEYLNDTALLYFRHDAGRTRMNRHHRLANDFYVDDQLGNTRMILTAERDTFAYAATYEDSRNTIETGTWRYRNEVKDLLDQHHPLRNHTPNNQYASRLNGSQSDRRVGSSIILRVMAGDTVRFSTTAFYETANGSNTLATVADLLAALTGSVIGTPAGSLDGKGNLPLNSTGGAMNTTAMNQLLQNHQNNQPQDNTPRAFLKAVLLDDNLQPVQTFSIRVNGGAGVVIDYNQTQVIPKNGFMYLYPMNESHLNVWFDNVAVEHRTGPLLQESAFYPFGAPIVPLSSHAALKTVNERGFQGNERDEEFGVDLSYFHARMYDASLGRFMGVDPEADKFSRFSPFHYAGNNPLHFVDPDGRFFFALLAKFAVKFIKKKVITKIAFKAGKKAAGAITNPFAKTFVGAFKMAKTGKALTAATKIGSWAGGLNNLRMNWDRMEGQNFGTALFRGAGYFLSGSAGGELAAMGTPLATLGGTVLGGMLNVETDLYSGSMGDVGFWRSFSRGGLSAMMGKSFAKSFFKPTGEALGPKWTKSWWGQSVMSATEKGAQTVMSNYNQYGKYNFGGDFMWKSLAAGAIGGAVKGLGGEGFSLLEKKIRNADFSLFSIGLSSVGGDITKKIALKSMSKEYKQYLQQNKQSIFEHL